jgi:hypothetical protein
MSSPKNDFFSLTIAAVIGALLGWNANNWLTDTDAQQHTISALENRILDLELLLAQKEEELKNSDFFHFGPIDQAPKIKPRITASNSSTQAYEMSSRVIDDTHAQASPSVDQAIKDLLTLAHGDPRNFHEKVNDFLAENPGRDGVAIASKGVFDLVDNRDLLSDEALEAIYQDQQDPEFRRVLAQVASMRGDNSLLEQQVAEAQTQLKSSNPADKQKALIELGKTRYAGAANAIVPLLQDNDIGVKLDALLALRYTGNQTHLRHVEALVDHPNESVSWLAKDVVNNLQQLSDIARTRVVSNEIAAELPPIQGQL